MAIRYYEDFAPSGYSYAERVGEPDELEAAVGRIVMQFSELHDTLRNHLRFLLDSQPAAERNAVERLSFRQKVARFGELTSARLASAMAPPDAAEQLEQLLALCYRAEELRKVYLESTYNGNVRKHVSVGADQGVVVHVEPISGALLLDVADYIAYVTSSLEELLVDEDGNPYDITSDPDYVLFKFDADYA